MNRVFRSALSLFAALAMLAGGTAAYAAVLSFSDGTFTDTDWALDIFLLEGDGGASTANQFPSGGNPNAFRQVENFVEAAPGAGIPSGVWGFHRRIGALYSPQALGAISSIDYAEDSIAIGSASGVIGEGQATGPALRQGGVVYIQNQLTARLITPDPVWIHKELLGLTQDDFVRVDDPTLHPDFAVTGGLIELGFFRANSTSPGGPGNTITAGIDNWRVTIRSVPEPSSLLLLVAACIGLLVPLGSRRRAGSWGCDGV